MAPRIVGMRFDLPFCIHLQNGYYDVGVAQNTYRIETRKAWRNSKDCSDDDSVAEQRLHFLQASFESGAIGASFDDATVGIGTNMEMVDDPTGRFRYTQVIVWTEHPSPDEIAPQSFLPEALTAVNRLVDVFRFVSGEAYLPPVQVEDVDYAEIAIPDTGARLYAGLFGKGMTNAVINESRAVHDHVREMLQSGEEIPLDAELRLAARRLLGQNLWRQAVIEAISSLEVFLGLTLHVMVDTNRMTEDEFEALMNEPPTDRLKAPLRDAVGCSPVDSSTLWKAWIGANLTRRQVVHQGMNASKDEAKDVVETVEALVAYVRENKAS